MTLSGLLVVELQNISEDATRGLFAREPTLHNATTSIPLNVVGVIPGVSYQVALRPQTPIPPGEYKLHFVRLDLERQQAEARLRAELKEAQNPDWDNLDLQAISEELSRRPSAEELQEREIAEEMAVFADMFTSDYIQVRSVESPQLVGAISTKAISNDKLNASAFVRVPLSKNIQTIVLAEALSSKGEVIEARFLLVENRQTVITSGSCSRVFTSMKRESKVRFLLMGAKEEKRIEQTLTVELAPPKGSVFCSDVE